jgi:hypothetical protein
MASEYRNFLGHQRGGHPHSARRGSYPRLGTQHRSHRISSRLLASTKSDKTVTVNVIIAWRCLSGLSLGKWMTRLDLFESEIPGLLFSTRKIPVWTSQHFRSDFAYPILELHRASGEPTLKAFTDQPGHRIRDKVYSMHSWRRAGRSRVSRKPRHDEPNPKGTQLPPPPKSTNTVGGKCQPPRRICLVATTNGISSIASGSPCSACEGGCDSDESIKFLIFW